MRRAEVGSALFAVALATHEFFGQLVRDLHPWDAMHLRARVFQHECTHRFVLQFPAQATASESKHEQRPHLTAAPYPVPPFDSV